MAPSAASPEVAAHAAEPPEAAVLASAHCMVVAPSNVLSACPVTAMEAVYESLSCPVTAMEAICESSFCPVTAMEAICESSFCPVTAMEAVYESLSCPVAATEAINEPSFAHVTEAVLEHLSRSEPAEKAISELSPRSETAMVSDFELSVLPVLPGQGGAGSVTNPVCGLPPNSHQRSPLHHIDSHSTLDCISHHPLHWRHTHSWLH